MSELRPCTADGKKAATRADHIRNMNDEEMGKFIDEISGFQADYIKYRGDVICAGHISDWLQQPVEEAQDGQA